MANDNNNEQLNQNNAEVQAAVDKALKDQKKKKKKKKLIIFGVILLLIIVLIIAFSGNSKEYDFKNPVAIVTVDTLLSDFNNDTANASEKYSDNVVVVTGKVGIIQDSCVILYPYDDDNYLYCIYAYMENTEDLKKFVVGDTITIEGVCSETTSFGDVDMHKCIITSDFDTDVDYKNATQVDVNELISAYKSNSVSANEQYKGKVISVTAVVNNVCDDYIVLEPADADAYDWDCDIEVNFEDNGDITKVAEDETVTIIGECYGDGDVYTVKICRAIVAE